MRLKTAHSSAMGIAKTAALPALLLCLSFHAAQGQDALAFNAVDTNSNSQISSEELKAMVPDASDAYKTRFVAVCMSLYDANSDGNIVSSEAAGLLEELAKIEANMYNAILFEMDDTDGDDELSEAETEASFSFSSAGCESPIEIFDVNANGKLNYNETKKMVDAVSALSVKWAGAMKCHTVSDLSLTGTFCKGDSRVARVCAPSAEDGGMYAKMKAHCMVKKFEENNALTTCTDMASDFCETVGGIVDQDAKCTLLCQQAMSECLLDSDCSGGTAGTMMTLAVTGQDVVTDVYPEIPFKVYAGYPWPFYGCADASFFTCGTQVASGTLSGSASSTDVSFKVGSGGAEWFLVVIGGSGGYGYSYYEKHMEAGTSNSVYGSMLKALSLGMDRLVLSWPHSGDLDMWVFATDSADNIKGSVGWRYDETTGTFGSTAVSFDKDQTSGLDGPEVISFSNMAGFTFQVWVHYYTSSKVFEETTVMAEPATVDVYCSQCHDSNGKTVEGLATSITQDYSMIPSGGRDWWNVGHFLAPSGEGAGMRVQWKTCRGQSCYSNLPAGYQGDIVSQGTLSIKAKNAILKGFTSVAATWEVYTAFPADYSGCNETKSCGNLAKDVSGNDSTGTIPSSGATQSSVQLPVAFGVTSYLVVVSYTGYYTAYVHVDLSGGSEPEVVAQMVPMLASGQDRVVLRWEYMDMDLWVVVKDSAGAFLGSFGYLGPGTYGGAKITLDIDGTNNDPGTEVVETTEIVGMSSGIYEVWVNSFSPRQKFSQLDKEGVPVNADVSQHLDFSVDVYCSACHDASGTARAGFVESATRHASEFPAADLGYSWMKVGQFTAPSPASGEVTNQWTRCVPSAATPCYSSSDPTSGSGRRRSVVSAPKPEAAMFRAAHSLPNGQPTTAIPPSIKFAKNPQWVSYKQFNDRVQIGLSRTTAKKGSKHAEAAKQMEHAAGLRAIGGARHSGRSSTIKAAVSGNKHLRAHAMPTYGYTVGDFAEPFHVSAIGDMHLVCCDRFERAVRETCLGFSETALSTWLTAGKTNWCHETSCFDGQGVRGWTDSLSWLDYTDYRWGNLSFTTRSECSENRDWPDLMEHFRSMEGCTGGLGKLLVPNRFHVWACFHNHPCATRALTDPVGLWILYEQGYHDFSIEQINILIQYVSGQVLLGADGWDKSFADASGRDWGRFSWTEIQSFFVFVVEMVVELGNVFGDVNDADVFGDLWWVGLESQSGTCQDIGRDAAAGFTCRATTCCFYHPMLGCQMQPTTHPCHGTGSWTISMSANGWSGGTSSLIQATYNIYQLTDDNRNNYWGCLGAQCGTWVKSGSLGSSEATSVSVGASYGNEFLVLVTSGGYINMYYTINMLLASEIITGQIIKTLSVNQDKMVLRWRSNQDLDLWVFVRNPPTSGGTVQGDLQGSVGPQYSKASLTTGGTSINYLAGFDSGFDGPEITGMQNAAGGVFEVWVNLWSQYNHLSFTRETVQTAPASVDIYCYQCHDANGGVKNGGVGSLTQDWNDVVDSSNYAWWKVGEFIAPSPISVQMRMQWVACTSNCYQVAVATPSGTGTLFMTADDTVTESRITGTYYIYKDFPASYEGCYASTTCGTLLTAIGTGSISASTDTSVTVPVNYGVSNYLIVMVNAAYYPSYEVVSVADGSTRAVTAQMVALLAQDTERLVLKWESFKDLDLWVVFKDASGDFVGSVGFSNKAGSFPGVGDATLDVDNPTDNIIGPETSLIQNMGTGTAEIWVHRYGNGNKFLPEDKGAGSPNQKGVRNDPAAVNVYCASCHNTEGVVVQGGVTTVTQIAATIPAGGAFYWKVGQFEAPSPAGSGVRLQWFTCVLNDGKAEVGGTGSGCWTDNDPKSAPGTRRRRSVERVKGNLDISKLVYRDPYTRKVQSERAKLAKRARQERIEKLDLQRQEHAESQHAMSHVRSRYYYSKNLEGGGIKSTFSTPKDSEKKTDESMKNAGRQWTDDDKKTVGSLMKNVQFFKRAVADVYGLDKMEDAIRKIDRTSTKEKFKIRSSDSSPAGPREAMCYVYDEMYKNWVPWGPNSILQIHDWSAVWNRPHWPQYEAIYKP